VTTILQERALLTKIGGSLRLRSQWGSRYDYIDARTVTEPATRVFVHISVTNPGNYSSDDAHARAIESIGISRFPATGISYNRLLMQSGTAYEGQPIGRRGAHTVNDFKRASCSTSGCPGRGGPLTAPDFNLNYNARAYVICQNVNDIVTDRQLDSLARAIAADKLAGFMVRTAEIHGHRCASSKSCPADLMWRRMGELEQKVNHYVSTGLDDDVSAQDVWTYKVSGGPQAGDATISVLAEASTFARNAELGVVALNGKVDELLARPAVDVDALAAAIVARLPAGAVDLAVVKQGVREVLLEGVEPTPLPPA
jgi:hypothetical protein